MTPSARREVAATMGAALLAALLLFLASAGHWAQGTGRRPAGMSFVAVHASVTGRAVAGVVEAVALLALAAVVAVPATRGRGRLVVGALVTAGGIAGAIGAVGTRSAARAQVLHRLPPGAVVSTSPWWVAALAGGALLAAVGVVVAVRGPSWSALSARYEPPAARRDKQPVGDAGAWDALDRGEDPTA